MTEQETKHFYITDDESIKGHVPTEKVCIIDIPTIAATATDDDNNSEDHAKLKEKQLSELKRNLKEALEKNTNAVPILVYDAAKHSIVQNALTEEITKKKRNYILTTPTYFHSEVEREKLEQGKNTPKTLVQRLSYQARDFEKISKELNSINELECAETILKETLQTADDAEIKTGFAKFDEALGGGLCDGRLYTIGATTGLGKTTFALQIAANVASQNRDVLMVALEMTSRELMWKNVSRIIAESIESKDANGNWISKTIPLAELLNSKRINNLNEDKKKAMTEALNKYLDKIAGKLNTIEKRKADVLEIRRTVEEFVHVKHSKPLVIVDYLQKLAGEDNKVSDKQKTDRNIDELKEIALDFDIPVIAISSFNRANYKEESNMTAFKESGSIEYSSDVLISLQLTALKAILAEKDNLKYDGQNLTTQSAVDLAMKSTPRRIEANILKNRIGIANNSCYFNYYPMCDYFAETEGIKQQAKQKASQQVVGSKAGQTIY
jgi:replicative DNA helicase